MDTHSPFTEERLTRLTESLMHFQNNNPDDVGIIKVAKLLREEGTERLLQPNQLPIHQLRADPEIAELLSLHRPASWGKKDPTSSDALRAEALIAAGAAWYKPDRQLVITRSEGGFAECVGCGERHSLVTAVNDARFHKLSTKYCYLASPIQTRSELGLKLHQCMNSDYDEPTDFANLRKKGLVRLSRLDGRIHMMEGRQLKRCLHCGVLVAEGMKYADHVFHVANCFPADGLVNGRMPRGYGKANSPVREQIIEPSTEPFPNS